MLEKLFNLAGIPIISYKEMEATNDLVRSKLSEGVYATKIPIYRCPILMFLTEFEPGAELYYHRHNCKEIVTIKKGSVLYKKRNYITGEKIVIHKNVKHAFTSPEGCELIVEFENPDI